MKKTISVILSLLICVLLSVSSNAQEEAVSVVAIKEPLCVDVYADACVLIEKETGAVLTGMNENKKVYPASITKIMSLILVCEALESGKLTLDMEITCSQSAAEKGGSQIWLEAGEVMTVDDLLKATVVASANDACCLLAEAVAGSEEAFCVMMNEKAKDLGMVDTNFDNCSGLDDDTTEHLTTAYDIALMSRELLKYEIIRNYTTIRLDTLRNGGTQLVNTNKLIRTYPGATGLKTGTTGKAGCCVSASAERDGMELIAVVLGADNSKDRFNGAKALLDWGFANYELYTPDADGLYPDSLPVSHGAKTKAMLYHEKSISSVIKKNGASSVEYSVDLPEKVEAPVKKDDIAGNVLFRVGDEIIGECVIKFFEDCEKMTMRNAVLALLRSFGENL